MKVKNMLLLGLIIGICTNTSAQNDTTINSVPFYWTFELGSSYLTTTNTIKNQKAPFLPTASGSFSFNWNFPLGNKRTIPMSGFFLSPGIGLGVSTYSINKNISETNGVITIEDIDSPYDYYYLQGIYLDLPFDIRYLTAPDSKMQNYSFDLGGKLGYLIYTEKEMQVKEGNNTDTYNSKHVGILNKYKYGITAKASYRKMRINKRNDLMGLSLSIIGNYILSDTFIDQEIINSKSFFIGVGMGFNFK